ncbi:hypothetical protein Q3G72_018113 [Acer saccharum]|nr:hypothetical protein Q3G72_018113 [Acer saccharum]
MSKSHETSRYYCWMLIEVVTDTGTSEKYSQTLIFMGSYRALCILVLFVIFDLFGSLHAFDVGPISPSALETITGTQFIADDENRSLVSSDGNFKLGFFSPAKSQARYVGIWFNKISEQTIVWVANRETPIKNSAVPHWRSGPWNGRMHNGLPDVRSQKDYFSDQNVLINITFVSNDNEIYLKFSPKKVDVFSIIVLESTGVMNRLIWHESQRWVKLKIILQDMCDEYMRCGANAICNEYTLAQCACLPGFERLYPQDWYLKCQETRKEACGKGDGEGFVRLEGVKFPDARNSTLYSNMSLEECERECLKSCKCTGYANVYVDEMGRGCIAWYGELRDMRHYKSGQDFYLRVDAVELAADTYKNAKVQLIATKSTLVFFIAPLVVQTLLAALCFYYLWRRNAKRIKGNSKDKRYCE